MTQEYTQNNQSFTLSYLMPSKASLWVKSSAWVLLANHLSSSVVKFTDTLHSLFSLQELLLNCSQIIAFAKLLDPLFGGLC